MIKLIKKAEYPICFFIWISSFLFIYYQYKSWDNQRLLEPIPFELQVSKILYVNEESWGLGPGGNETGLIVYELPDEIANEIQKIGLAKLTQGAASVNWEQTPIQLTDEWGKVMTVSHPKQNTQHIKIANYLEKYGFSISLDQQIESEIDQAITATGSYYAYTRVGVIIVIPNSKKVIYAYAG